MSMAITHFMIGMLFGIAVLSIFRFYKKPIPHQTLVLFLFGIFGMIPDLDKLFTFFPQHAAWMNIFAFHILLDKIDLYDTTIIGAISVAITLGVLTIYSIATEINVPARP
jgi:hypothetical protein